MCEGPIMQSAKKKHMFNGILIQNIWNRNWKWSIPTLLLTVAVRYLVEIDHQPLFFRLFLWIGYQTNAQNLSWFLPLINEQFAMAHMAEELIYPLNYGDFP